MASVVCEILSDIVDALRATNNFSVVTLGDVASTTQVPRATVIYEGQESLPPDDSSTTSWVRIRVTISIRTRSQKASGSLTRANELCEIAAGALLSDPYRGGRCHDLPIGKATEIGRSEVAGGIRRPEVEMTLNLRCHFETQEPA